MHYWKIQTAIINLKRWKKNKDSIARRFLKLWARWFLCCFNTLVKPVSSLGLKNEIPVIKFIGQQLREKQGLSSFQKLNMQIYLVRFSCYAIV